MDPRWPTSVIRWNQWLARRHFGSPLAGVDVGPTLTHHWNQWFAQRHVIWSVSNVGPTDVQRLGQRWTTIYFCHRWANVASTGQNDVGPTIVAASNFGP